jgi:hypothetical protein
MDNRLTNLGKYCIKLIYILGLFVIDVNSFSYDNKNTIGRCLVF